MRTRETTPRPPGPGDRRPVRERFPLGGALRLGRPSDIWFKPALSVVAATAPPHLILLAAGRLDLAMYTMAGSLCALYAHHRPYRARARVLAGVVLGMTGGLAVALVTAALTANAVLLVSVGALLAAAQKVLCEATRLGPPGNVVLTFVTSAALFAPQTPDRVPAHVALALAAGLWAWLVCMAPALLRPHGPERRATAQALDAVAAYAGQARETPDGGAAGHLDRPRATAAAAVHAARDTLRSARPGPPRPGGAHHRLAHLLIRAEATLAAPEATTPERLRSWARALRDNRPVPRPDDLTPYPTPYDATPYDSVVHDPAAHDPASDGRERAEARVSPWRRLAPFLPLAVRTVLGCVLAGQVSLALGVGRPYWALVTAASLYQANVTLTWSRGVQRVVGNLVGVLAFAAVVPLTRVHPLALVLLCLALSFGAEALIGRNYWLGTVCVTPMALLVTGFAHAPDAGALVVERVADTLVGAVVGFAAAVAVTDRRAADRLHAALTTAERARETTDRLLAAYDAAGAPGARPAPGPWPSAASPPAPGVSADPAPGHGYGPVPVPAALDSARHALAAALVDLRARADAVAGEWRRHALPEERVVAAERSGHRTLAATVRRQGLLPVRSTSGRAEGAQP
ncbi:FUSC family protein [Streptomyces sp. NPDC058417]|uniref:FUSC family protein n=2 Tax=Streptomyces TaxID=1883 RepID=UPI003662D0B8